MKKASVLFTAIVIISLQQLFSQQVLMQGWYWDYPKTAESKSWADTLRLKAASLKQAGITHIWFPPHAVASSGTASNGYDPKDLFVGNQTTGLGTRNALDAMLAEFTAQGIAPVADLIYNHRDGGSAENNPAVKDYILTHYNAAKQPYPSDRFRCALPLGGTSGNGAGDYYFKISSKTGDVRFHNYGYKVYMETKTRGWQNLSDANEVEPNGGGDCGQGNNTIQLGRNYLANVDAVGCLTDEFHLNISTSDFNAAGDTLYIYLTNTGGYSDHRIYGLWSGPRSADIANDILYQTYTNYNNMPSGRGQMNYEFFKPNSSNVSSTFLSGDWDAMNFFYDYDQFQKRTKDTLINWTKWNWTDLGVRGLRMDAIKHFTPDFVGDMLDSLHKDGMDPSMVVGEWFGDNTAELSGWINNVKAAMEPATQAAIQPKIFDFSLRENLRKACDDAAFDVRNVFNGSLRDAAGVSGFNIVTFVNNHDFRNPSGFESLIRNDPKLAYAYILTNNQLGVPTIFYPDYYGYPAPSGGKYSYHPGLPPMDSILNRLMKVLKMYTNGSLSVDYLNRFSTPYSSSFISGSSDKALIYQIEGSASNGNKDVIIAINFSSSTLQVDHAINTRSGSIPTGTRFTDVLAQSPFPYAQVNGSGQVYLELPAKTFSVWVQGTENILPLEILDFGAKANDKKVEINFEISENEKAKTFEIERADEANRFKKIGTIIPTSKQGNVEYYFSDANPMRNTGILYRLKVNSKDGSVKYSDIKIVRIEENEMAAQILGNPVNDQLKIKINLPEKANIKATIVSLSGQVISTQQSKLGAGESLLQLPVSKLGAGSYQLVVENGNAKKVISFVKE